MASFKSEKRRSLTGSASFETVARSDDLLVQIFLHLPAKTVLSFRTVNKQWHSLISSPEFRRIHCCHNFKPSLSGLFLYDNRHSNCSKTINFDSNGNPMSCLSYIFPPDRDKRILESCNGLILYSYRSGFTDFSTEYYVGNPTTKQSALLPSHGVLKQGSPFSLSLAFDPSLSPHYKVVYVWWSESSLKFFSRVYSSITCCWEPSDYIAYPSIGGIGKFSRAVYCNGALHWIYGSDHLVYYKVCEDCIGIVKLPSRHTETISIELMRSSANCTVFAASQNNLVFVERIYHNNSNPLIVYELDKDYWGFNGKYLVDLGEMLSPFPNVTLFDYHLLSAFQGAKEGDIVILAWIKGALIAHHTKDNSTEVLLEFRERAKESRRYSTNSHTVHNYIESLCPV